MDAPVCVRATRTGRQDGYGFIFARLGFRRKVNSMNFCYEKKRESLLIAERRERIELCNF